MVLNRIKRTTMVQTFNGPDNPGVRLADVTTTGFKIRMNELVANGGKETLATVQRSQWPKWGLAGLQREIISR